MKLLRFLFKDAYRTIITPAGRQFLWLLLRYGDIRRYQPTRVSFGPFRFEVPDALSFVWQHKEIFVDEYYLFKPTQPNPVIFDCGANIGTSIAYFRQTHPTARIVAFEADPTIGTILTRNLQQNTISNIEVITKAVWVDDAGVDFGSEASDGSSMFSDAPKNRVPSVRLRDYLLRESHIDFLKIDIEGAETAVLDDCRDALSHVQNLFVEFHTYVGQPQALASVVQVIEQNGFRYYVDTNQHRTRPFLNHRYRGNASMDLQLNLFAYRP